MLFNSVQFLLFFIFVYGLYLVLGHRWQNRLLIVASCLFYSAWNWKFLGVMFLSITTDYFCSRYMGRSDDPRHRKALLFLSLFVNLGVLGFFKYYNFFIGNLTALLDIMLPFKVPSLALRIVLPLGISFYTFEAISYTVDVYKRTIKPATSYWDYLLFVIYFPHLIAGPIMRAKDFLPQIVAPRQMDRSKFTHGAYLVFLGLFQKIFVADNMAKIVNPVFNQPGNAHGADILIAMYAFTFQIFGDFAGYSNMARGLSLMMGFAIAVNFHTPFFATSVQDFWNRWHISLSQWIRDYLYLPLMWGLRRVKGNDRLCLALLIAMSAMGLWHGAAWNFVLFGVYYGVLLVLYLIVIRINFATLVVPKTPWGTQAWFWLRVVFVFHLTVLGMTIFRCHSLTQRQSVLGGLFFNAHPSTMNMGNLMDFIALALPLLALQWMEFYTQDIFFILKRHWLVTNCALAFMACLLLAWGVIKEEEFIYFQF